MSKKLLFLLLSLLIKQFPCFSQNHVLYGVTSYGGSYNSIGVLFCYVPQTGKYFVLDNFNNQYGNLEPLGGSLIQDSVSGYIYGMTTEGGDAGYGTIFRYKPIDNVDTVMYNFNTPTGILPWGGLCLASNGLLYGMTSSFSTYDAVFFSFDPKTFIYTEIFSFNGTNGADGQYCQPIQAIDSNIYGMTPAGGINNTGILFRYNPFSNQDTVVLNFNSLNGSDPAGSVIQAANGLLYGLTAGGGLYNSGVFFSYDPLKKKDSVIYNFNFTNPVSDFYQASNGILYAIIPVSSSVGIFSYNPLNGKDTVVTLKHEEAFNPNANNDLVQDPDNGLLYGTTSGYGFADNLYGCIFSFNPITLKDSIVVIFNDTDGETPVGRLLLSRNFPDTVGLGLARILNNTKIVNIYPNPFLTKTTIVFSDNDEHFIEMCDITGRIINKMQMTGKQNLINTDDISPGMYFIKIYSKQKQYITTLKALKE